MSPAPFRHSPLPIHAFGQGWLVVEKPSGMSTHNEPGDDLCSRVGRYVQLNKAAATALAYEGSFGLHPVHRLDKETSGIILLSCRRTIFDHFAHQFAANEAVKHYMALVHGSVPASRHWRQWRWPLSRNAAGRRNPRGRGPHQDTRTLYRLKRSSRYYSLIECRPVTGRTHQIRRHAALAGHPLVGDRRYGSLRACRYLEKHHGFRRLGLHACALTITLPDTHVQRRFSSWKLPLEMTCLMGDGKVGE